MKEQSYQRIILVFSWLLFIWQPLLAKDPVKSKEPIKEPPMSESLITQAGDNRVRLLDNYNFDSLQTTAHYVEWLDDGFNVQDGLLKAAAASKEKAILQVLPLFGNEFEFSIDVKYEGEPLTEAGFTLLINSGTNPLEPAAGFIIELSKSRVSSWYGQQSEKTGKDYLFQPQKWYTCEVVAVNRLLSIFINNEEVLTLPLAPAAKAEYSASAGDAEEDEDAEALREADYTESWQDDPSPASALTGMDMGFNNAVNFSLMITGQAEKNELSFDNLTITGKAVPATADMKAAKSRFLIGKKEQQLAVLYTPGSEQWAANQLAGSVKYLQNIYESIYQIAPKYSNLGLVQVNENYNLQNIKAVYSDAVSGLRSASPARKGVLISEKTGLTSTNETESIDHYALLHFWSGYYGEEWMKESVPYLILNMQAGLDNKLVTLKDIHQQHQHAGDLTDLSKEFINIFSEIPISSSTPLGLWKAHIFWYLIYKTIGLDGWQKLHKGLVSGTQYLDSVQLKNSLEGIKGINLNNLFTGWVTPGKGKYDPIDALLDADQDGLYNLDEQLYGTNLLKSDTDGDNYPDLSEIQAGYNPMDKKEPEQGTILIDGDFLDWSSTYVYEVDEPQDGGKYDLYTLKYVWDKTNNLFFLKINFFKPLFLTAAGKRENYYTQIQFDTNNDRETDYRVVFWTGTTDVQDWAGVYQYEKDSGANPNKQKKQIELKEGEINFKPGEDCLELVIPLVFMNMTRSSLFSIMVDGGQETQLDRFDNGWIKIIPVMPYLQRPKKVWTPGNVRKATNPAVK